MPVSSIILTENNLTQIPNTFEASVNSAPYNKFYLPIADGSSLRGTQISLSKINMYYAYPNIDSSNYAAATIDWPVGASYSSFQWNLTPNFNYASVSQLNDALQQFCIQNGLYLINGSSNVYYIQLVANPNSYGIDLTLFKVPTSLPGGYTAPSNWVGYPSSSVTPKVTFKSQFNKIVGFPSGSTYNGLSTQTTYTSTFCPQLSPTSSILVSVNIAFNPLALNGSSSVVNVFTSKGTNYGSLITVEPNELIWFDVNTTGASMLVVELFNQDYQPLNQLDPQTTFQFLIRPKES